MARHRALPLIAILSALALLLAACGGGGGDDSDTTSAGTEGGDAAGDATEGGDAAAENNEAPDQGVTATSLDWGLIYDQTGPTAGTQVPFANGIKTYFNKVNEEGGVNGRTINVIEEDEQYDAAVGVQAYNKLVSQTPVVGMTGANNSSFQAAIAEDIDTNGVPIVGAQSTTQVAVNPFRENFFAMECTYPDQADVAVAFGFRLAGSDAPTAATMVGNVASGLEWSELIEARVTQGGGEFLGQQLVEYGAADADQQAQAIASQDPDLIFFHGGDALAVTFIRSLEKFGVTDTPIIGIFAQKVDDVPNASQTMAENYYAVHCYAAANEPGVEIADELIAAAQANGIDESEYLTSDFANGYVVGMAIVEGIRNAGAELTRDTLREGLEQISGLDTGGLSPAVTFTADDHVGVKSVVPFKWNFDEGAYEQIGTFDDWSGCITNFYVTESLESWSPDCAPDVAAQG
ncbi:MAG TPA: ABC transporter substrate-binding protein [Egibacteraceae bacterium]